MNARQHRTHAGLLTSVEASTAPHARLDAIIVPNGRAVFELQPAIRAARQANAHLLLLCSLEGDALRAALAARRAGVRVTAIDTDRLPRWLVPTFVTDKLLRRGEFHRKVDTSLKRNLGLLIAILTGWKRILFLDDDIVLPEPDDLAAAAGLLREHPVVGLRNAGMPDNSVVCHALRGIGAAQESFIGGGALVVGEKAFSSFFPNIYNEDWFFLLDGCELRSTAVTGMAIQRPYDPYNVRRARAEELGDTLAEGLYGLLDNGRPLTEANSAYWTEFLSHRRQIIRMTIAGIRGSAMDRAEQAKMVRSLEAAIGSSQRITPDLCVQYLRAWKTDCVRWRNHVTWLRRDYGERDDINHTLAMLGVADFAQPGIDGRITPVGWRRPSRLRTGESVAKGGASPSPARGTAPALSESRRRQAIAARGR
ncbi:hypothetical protein [Amycolatopsis kentuckyensis]|uniref:hypothetical protein n=1 Tax=Amycolatopsis kentuckyensis TaxID=218823 RepID=UPI001FC8F857|nr:hypothetical protein [Amycolatopsis kentuckyensis]